ncbi:uncharacterized protein LOC127286716 [Leptopilina boulardi]|uniref:uncharacterized protein LOC127286716 n=1 Tax=Leptopilina boulardi TaxID=63433 RepID=UPI0021F5D9E3|nr:uncharacterized protein LOC127286716 [Leptopilina boulardi]
MASIPFIPNGNSLRDTLDNSCFNMGNLYFPNMCHVCRCFGENVSNLKTCGACGMISYCSKEHQIKDWSMHKEFCNVLCIIKKKWKINDNLYESLKNIAANNSYYNLNNIEDKLQYYHSLEYLSKKLKEDAVFLLKRKLNKLELEIISYPRVCAICYETKSSLLINCKKCPQFNLCKEHINDYSNHESECLKIISCFNAVKQEDISQISLLLDNIVRNMFTTTYLPKEKKLSSSIQQFIETRLTIHLSKLKINEAKFTNEMRLIYFSHSAERYSRSLTLLFAIEKLSLNNLNSMTIHIVGASLLEEVDDDWEMIFNFLPKLQKLTLILIGLELLSLEEKKKIKSISNTCKNRKKKLIIVTKNMVYDQYCRDENYLKPNIIACFNPGLHAYSTWLKSIDYFNKEPCPLLITAFNKIEGMFDKDMIDSKYPLAKCIYNDFNPFTSLLYFRESIFLPISTTNQFMFLYQSLDGGKKCN